MGAKVFAQLVNRDDRFKVVNQVQVGLVCFKLVGSNDLNRSLLSLINDSGRLHMVPTYMKGEYVIRLAVCAENASEEDMQAAWDIIKEMANILVEPLVVGKPYMEESTFKSLLIVDCCKLEKLH